LDAVAARYCLYGATVMAVDGVFGSARSRTIDIPDGARLLTATPESDIIVLVGA